MRPRLLALRQCQARPWCGTFRSDPGASRGALQPRPDLVAKYRRTTTFKGSSGAAELFKSIQRRLSRQDRREIRECRGRRRLVSLRSAGGDQMAARFGRRLGATSDTERAAARRISEFLGDSCPRRFLLDRLEERRAAARNLDVVVRRVISRPDRGAAVERLAMHGIGSGKFPPRRRAWHCEGRAAVVLHHHAMIPPRDQCQVLPSRALLPRELVPPAGFFTAPSRLRITVVMSEPLEWRAVRGQEGDPVPSTPEIRRGVCRRRHDVFDVS